VARIGVETAKGLVKAKLLAARRAKVEAIAFQYGISIGEIEGRG